MNSPHISLSLYLLDRCRIVCPIPMKPLDLWFTARWLNAEQSGQLVHFQRQARLVPPTVKVKGSVAGPLKIAPPAELKPVPYYACDGALPPILKMSDGTHREAPVFYTLVGRRMLSMSRAATQLLDDVLSRQMEHHGWLAPQGKHPFGSFPGYNFVAVYLGKVQGKEELLNPEDWPLASYLTELDLRFQVMEDPDAARIITAKIGLAITAIRLGQEDDDLQRREAMTKLANSIEEEYQGEEKVESAGEATPA